MASDRYVFGEYLRAVSESNIESPASILKADGRRTVTFKSISFIKRSTNQMKSEKVVQARVTLTDVSRKFPAPIEYHSIVTMTFQYSNLKLNEEERYMNPLGFLVTEYAIEREVVKE